MSSAGCTRRRFPRSRIPWVGWGRAKPASSTSPADAGGGGSPWLESVSRWTRLLFLPSPPFLTLTQSPRGLRLQPAGHSGRRGPGRVETQHGAGRGRGAGWDQQQERVGLPVCCCPSARPAGRCWVTQPVSSGASRTVREKQCGTGTGVPRPRGDSRDAFRQLPVILGRGPGAFACASETETARQPWAGGQMCLSCLGALAHAAPSAAVPRPPQRAPVHSPAL